MLKISKVELTHHHQITYVRIKASYSFKERNHRDVEEPEPIIYLKPPQSLRKRSNYPPKGGLYKEIIFETKPMQNEKASPNRVMISPGSRT